MDFWADLWAAFTGFGTLALALATFRAIRQSQKQRADGERQHRDQFKPICLLAPNEDLDIANWRSDLVATAAAAPDNLAYRTVLLRCVLRNVGVGPAMKLRLSFRFLDMGGWTSEPWELSPLGAGETVSGTAGQIKVPFRIDDQFNATDFATLASKTWEIVLEYEDVFGQPFRSIHSKMLFDPDPATFGWTGAGGEDQTKAVPRAIPWLTYSVGLANPAAVGRRPA
ncbi:MAG: hypothetical protein ACREEW_18195 [Caulobacteraceae bacterium]